MSKVTVKLRLDIIVPMTTIPLTLSVATISSTLTFLMLTCLFSFLFYFYRSWRGSSEQHRTQFFYFWSIVSFLWGFFVFEIFIMPFREILLWENLLLVTVGLLLINNVLRLRDSAGVIRRPQQQRYYTDGRMLEDQTGDTERDFPKSIEEMTAPTLPASDVNWIDSRPIKDGKLSTWCSHCRVKKPPRSGHCRLCNECIRIRDHHNIWLDTCIGVENHSAYFMVLLQTIFCGYYGSQLSITTICTPEIYFNWFLVPNDCRFLYIDFRTAVSFVTVCYMIVVTTMVVIAMIWQLIFISQNVTQQEFRAAKRRGWVNQKIFVENNLHDQGFIMNLVEFFIVGRKSENTGKIQV